MKNNYMALMITTDLTTMDISLIDNMNLYFLPNLTTENFSNLTTTEKIEMVKPFIENYIKEMDFLDKKAVLQSFEDDNIYYDLAYSKSASTLVYYFEDEEEEMENEFTIIFEIKELQ